MSTSPRTIDRFIPVPGQGHLYRGEAGDHGAACGTCTQTFEGPTAELVARAAQACEENDRRRSDYYDDVHTDLYPYGRVDDEDDSLTDSA